MFANAFASLGSISVLKRAARVHDARMPGPVEAGGNNLLGVSINHQVRIVSDDDDLPGLLSLSKVADEVRVH